MKDLRDLGVISNYWDYEDLPVMVLEHARVLIEARYDALSQVRHA